MILNYLALCILWGSVWGNPNFKAFANLEAMDGYSVVPVASGLDGTRTLVVDRSNGDLITVARGIRQIVALWETGPFSGQFERAVLVDASAATPSLNLSHGLALRGNYIYASSDVNIWRWPYKTGERKTVNLDARETIVFNMGAGGRGGAPLGHTTRTFVFGTDGYMYIGISSLNNVDQDSVRSRVRRLYFPNDTIPTPNGVDFETLEVWSDGLRNPLGLDFDAQGRLWETDNGPDNLVRQDLGEIYPDNPCEELNLLTGPANSFYGYPYCFSVGNLTRPLGQDPRTLDQLAWPDFINDGTHTDAWCANVTNNRRPEVCMPPHASPITLRIFKDEDGCGKTNRSFSCDMTGDAFVTLHGSWNRPVPVGYAVIRIPFDKTTRMPTRQIETIFSYKDLEQKCQSGGNANYKCFRPAGLVFKDGVMYISSAATGEIVRVMKGRPADVERDPSGNGALSMIGQGWGLMSLILFSSWMVYAL